MTLSLPQMTLPEQVQTFVDKTRSVDYKKHFDKTVETILLIAAWTVVTANRIHKSWTIIRPHVIRFLRWLADTLEGPSLATQIIESAQPLPENCEPFSPTEEVEPKTSRKPKPQGFAKAQA